MEESFEGGQDSLLVVAPMLLMMMMMINLVGQFRHQKLY
jgi:hypothetical protein